MRTVCVVAHFNSQDQVEDSFKRLVMQMSQACTHTIVVSTSRWPQTFVLPPKVEVLERSNEGYDFCSYKTGIQKIGNRLLVDYDRLLLINSSYFFSSSFNLNSILEQIEKLPGMICGLTSNDQFYPHLQSSFLYFKKSVLLTRWFQTFWDLVQPLNVKSEIIWKFEIGLTETANEFGITVSSLYGPLSPKSNRTSLLKGLIPRFLHKSQGNLFFTKPRFIYEKVGLYKWEYLKIQSSQSFFRRLLSVEDLQEVQRALVSNPGPHSKFNEKLNDSENVLAWLSDTDTFDGAQKTQKPDVAIVIHLYYLETLGEIIEQLKNIPEAFDVFITVVRTVDAFTVREVFREELGKKPKILLVENRGRDVWPFVKIINCGLLKDYSFICKIHSKKSSYSSNGAVWRKELYSEVLGSKSNVIGILNLLRSDEHVGIIGPSKNFLTKEDFWGSNKNRMRSLGQKMGMNLSSDPPLRFFAGTMFWARRSILDQIKNANLSDADFEDELGQLDGTLAHAIERIFILIAEQSGCYSATCGQTLKKIPEHSENRPIVYG